MDVGWVDEIQIFGALIARVSDMGPNRPRGFVAWIAENPRGQV